MATLYRVIPELAERITFLRRVLKEKYAVNTDITEGFREYAEQLRLREKYLRDPKRNPLAAVPGYSNHGKVKDWKTKEQDDSSAVDIVVRPQNAKTISLQGDVARLCGLIRTVKGEYWHLELDPKRKDLPYWIFGKEEVMGLIPGGPAGTEQHPTLDGGWIIGPRGHVYGFDGCADRHYGNWDDATRGDPNRFCVDIVSTKTGNGYWLISNYGETYAYGDAPQVGNYREKDWGQGAIVGAFRNSKIPVTGGVTLIRDDGKAFNPYRLPA